ncbi:baseplate hub subunit and tail lysozyme [Vibrio phage vB_VchM_Kuja]|uniref:Baseplate hub subunit and tail lysozyme n=1 Tax=Vibrio phage vB_VchM_Kuja TaxID=2686437 RepID=A0A6B9J5B7_9CAUD|nr:baseplate hub subunit and tail lysozyme [Vibrio phage vB_VchM_Kuja]QGZ16051.1 baseplate hub subunit and tail lysozyme [Vibrio phage vB_VchM_Kuja]
MNICSDLKWFFGIVEEHKKPTLAKVRIFGVHNIDPNLLPTENLPEASIMKGTNSSNINGLGESTTGLWEGSFIFGFSIDEAYTNIYIVGTLSNSDDLPNAAQNNKDELINFINSSLTSSEGKGTSFKEPELKTNFQYPYTDVTVTKSGHIKIADNTNGQEQLIESHRNGSYNAKHASGDVVNKTTNNLIDIVLNDHNMFVKRHYRYRSHGSYSMRLDGTNYMQSNRQEIESANILFKTNLFEVNGNTNVYGNLIVSSSITVPLLKVKKIICDDIEVSNIMLGTAAFANQAGIAGGLGGVSPVKGSKPDVNIPSPIALEQGEKTNEASNRSQEPVTRNWKKVLDKLGPLKSLVVYCLGKRD